MDEFDNPTIIPARKDETTITASQTWTRATRLGTGAISVVSHSLAKPAAVWKAEANRRSASHTDDALAKVREANKLYLAAMRDLRRDRRAFEKARDEVPWWHVFNGERRAARIVARDSAAMAREARQARREARKNYPMLLPALAVRCHAAHLAPATLWAAASDSLMSSVALYGSVTAVALNAATAWLAGRQLATDAAADEADVLQPTKDETQLMQQLEPSVWQPLAEARGLGDVVATGSTLTPSGIQAKLKLNGRMDVATLRNREALLRAVLQLREGTRMELREGKTGGTARLTLRTRSASADLDMTGWWAGAPWAVNTVTGETVSTPLGKRMLIAGTSGSGKSWSARPLMAEASAYEDHRLVIFDRKYIEARTWEHRARIAVELPEMEALCDELEAEGEHRLKLIPRGRDTVEISPSMPRITVFVDEGGELISDCVKEYDSIIDRLRTIARKYRAAEIILVWATQKPTMSGKGCGIDSQISGQMQDRLCLAVTTATESRTMFGEDAAETGWKAHELPMPGYALYKQLELGPKCQPQMLRMRAMSPQQVIDLPARPIWSRRNSWTGTTQQDIETRQSMEAQDPWAGKDVDVTMTLPVKKPRISAEDRDDQLMAELATDPCRSLSSLAKAVDASKSVVKRRLEQMEADGLVRRDDEGCWYPVH